MTFREIVEEYKKRFILILEDVGEVKQIRAYTEIESILSTNLDGFKITVLEENSIQDNCPILCFTALYITAVLIRIYGIAEVSSWGDVCKHKLFRFIYDNYLKKMTEDFVNQFDLKQLNINQIGIMVADGSKEESIDEEL